MRTQTIIAFIEKKQYFLFILKVIKNGKEIKHGKKWRGIR